MYYSAGLFSKHNGLSDSVLLVHGDEMSLLVQLQAEVHVQVARVLLHLLALHRALQHVPTAAPDLVAEIEHGLLPVRLAVVGRRAEGDLLPGEEYIEVAHQRVHVLRVLAIQFKRAREVQILLLHRVDVQILNLSRPTRAYENAARIGDRLRVGNHVHQRLEQRNLLDSVHLEAVHVVPDYSSGESR